jgi:proteasome lid subunit RPN8/RPN11
MKPEEQFAAVKDMRAAGLKLLAIWHSHPASPARMSAEDMRLAYTPDIVYVIVSLADDGGSRVRAFTVQNGTALEIAVTVEQSH